MAERSTNCKINEEKGAEVQWPSAGVKGVVYYMNKPQGRFSDEDSPETVLDLLDDLFARTKEEVSQ